MRLVDLSGQVFGRLTVAERASPVNKRTLWRCVCSCGSIVSVDAHHLKTGHTQSCGCIYSDGNNNRRHGRSDTSEYRIWNAMRQRCTNPKNSHFKYYGGRGITVCPRWMASFDSFYADMGDRPSVDHSIDRINNDGNYEPGNCRWATMAEQRRNRRPRVIGKVHGEII